MSAREVIDRWVQATCSGDPVVLAELVSPEAVTVDEPSSTRAFGPRGYLDYVSGWTQAFSLGVELNSVREVAEVAPDVWEVSFRVRLTHVGTFTSRWGDAPPSGKEFMLTINERITVTNGAITELRVIYNLLLLLREVGVRA